ncbi:MAG TPA: hypothetical protein VFN75_09675 [Pseudonocardiaceae bacterium]|nr:hypothetical protein [Pseudonocardiaceae bacterium]
MDGVNSCGHDAPRVTLPARCTECGAFATRPDEPWKVHPDLPGVLETLTRWWVKHFCQPPELSGVVIRRDHSGH